MGWNTVVLKHKKEWDAIRAEAEIYELQLPLTLDAINVGQEEEFKGSKSESSWRQERQGTIMEIVEVFSNPKGTVKVIVVGKDKLVAMFSREAHADGFPSLGIDRYDSKASDIFDNISKGTFILCGGGHYSGEKEISFVSRDKTLADVKKTCEALDNMDVLRYSHNNYKWTNESTVKSYGTVSLNEVLNQQVLFLMTLRRFQWIHRKEQWDLWNAVKARVKITRGAEHKVEVTALDGNKYTLKCPLKVEEKQVGWNDSDSVYKLDFWLPFAYRKPDDNFLKQPRTEQTADLMDDHFLHLYYKLESADFELGFNKKQVSITRKTAQNGARLVYLDGKLTKSGDVTKKLKEYFVLNKPILEDEPEKPNEEKVKQPRVMSAEAQHLMSEGLNGVMRDLEGEFPFHLNLLYKEHQWYLEIAGKEFYIKGGYTELKRIKSAILGNARIDHSEDGYDPRSTKVVRKRIAHLVGDENALWIILQVKRMGAMMKAMTGN